MYLILPKGLEGGHSGLILQMRKLRPKGTSSNSSLVAGLLTPRRELLSRPHTALFNPDGH